VGGRSNGRKVDRQSMQDENRTGKSVKGDGTNKEHKKVGREEWKGKDRRGNDMTGYERTDSGKVYRLMIQSFPKSLVSYHNS